MFVAGAKSLLLGLILAAQLSSAADLPTAPLSSPVKISVGSRPDAVAVNPTSNMIFVANQASGTVSVINGYSDAVIATVPVGVSPNDLAVNPLTNRVYVANERQGPDDWYHVSVIDATTRTIATDIRVTQPAMGVGINERTNTIYVSNYQQLTVIDGVTNSIKATIPWTCSSVCSYLGGVAVDPARNRVFVANQVSYPNSAGYVSVIDGETNARIADIPVGQSAWSVAFNSRTNSVYAPDYSSSTVSVIDASTNAVATRVPVGMNPSRVAVDRRRNTVYVANSTSNDVSIIDGATNVVTATAPVALMPFGIAVNQWTDSIYVANYHSDYVSVLRAGRRSALDTQ